ncbi:hypothetical protein ACWCYY_10885 [Kitasatospora sp. NPDC001664]
MKSLHYLITLQWPIDRGFATVTRDGVLTAPPGATRQQAVISVLDAVRQQTGAPDGASVMFLSLAPNTL